MQKANLSIVCQPLFGDNAKLSGVILNPNFAKDARAVEATPARCKDFESYLKCKMVAKFSITQHLYTLDGAGMLLVNLREGENWRHRLELDPITTLDSSATQSFVYHLHDEASPTGSESREWLLGVFMYWVEFMSIMMAEAEDRRRMDASHIQ